MNNIVYVKDSLDSQVEDYLLASQKEFRKERPGHTMITSMAVSAAIYFPDSPDMILFTGILDDKGVKYSMHYAYVNENFRLTHWRQDMDRRLNINYKNNV